MTAGQTIIVDLTRKSARICVSDAAVKPLEMGKQLVIPGRVAVQADEAGLRFLAGNQAANIREDSRTLIFDDLSTDLWRIEDEELASELALSFWSEIHQTLLSQGLLKDADETVRGYIIPHYLSPPALHRRIREACAKKPPPVAGFFHEGICLLLGFLQSEAFPSTLPGFDSALPVTICLFVADNDALDVACFDYRLAGEGQIAIRLRNYFSTTYNDLIRKLKHSDWAETVSVLCSLESPDLAGPAKEMLKALLEVVWTDDVVKERHQMAELPWLKARGAAYIASCCSGRGPANGEYSIELACHIGVRLNQDSFLPLITSTEFVGIRDFPHSSLRTFKLRGHPGNEMRIQLYCGFSDRVEDATLLGHLTLSQTELARLTLGSESALAAVLKLDAPGSGEFTLGLLPGDKIISSMPFSLPGLVI